MQALKGPLIFLFAVALMFGEFMILLIKGHEPYPAIVHPGFALVPNSDGFVVFSRPRIVIHTGSHDSVVLDAEKVFATLPAHFVPFVFGVLEGKRAALLRQTEQARPLNTERGFADSQEGKYLQFRDWIHERVVDVIGKAAISRILVEQADFRCLPELLPLRPELVRYKTIDTFSY